MTEMATTLSAIASSEAVGQSASRTLIQVASNKAKIAADMT